MNIVEQLPYIKQPVNVYVSPTAKRYYTGVKRLYRENKAREKVVLRVDLSPFIFAGLMTAESIAEHKTAYILAMLGFTTDANEIREEIEELYLTDSIFQDYVANICYFEMYKYPESSLFGFLCWDFENRCINAERVFKMESVISGNIFLSNWDEIYVGINDKRDAVCEIPDKYKVEVLSFASKWNCKYPREI